MKNSDGMRVALVAICLTLGGVELCLSAPLPAVSVGGKALRVEPMRCSAMPVNIRWPGHQREKDQTEICFFARFDLAAPVEVVVTAPRAFTNAVVRPVSKKVAVTREGGTVRFTLAKPGAYSVEFDGRHENLMVFADAPRDYFKGTELESRGRISPKCAGSGTEPGGRISPKCAGSGTEPGGRISPKCAKENEDKSVTEVHFGEMHPRGKDVRYFGPGEHDVGLITMRAGETLFIDEGAVVYGRIEARDAPGIRICGKGILDASRVKEVPKAIDPKLAEEQRKKGWAITNVMRFNTIFPQFCDNVRIEGITIRDSQIYAIRPVCCNGLTVENVKILGSWRYNSDGIDMHNCRHVRIRDCFIRTYDDSICVKGFDYCLPEAEMTHNGVVHDVFEDVVVERCTIWNDWGRALEIGAETRAREIRNVTFRDCDILAVHDVALDVQNCDQAHVHDIRFENIRVEYDPDQPKTAYSASAKDFDPKSRRTPVPLVGCVIPYIPEYSKAGAENRGRTTDIVFRDIDVYAPTLPGGFLCGFDKNHRIERVTFDRIRLNGKDVTDDFRRKVSCNEFALPDSAASQTRPHPLVTVRLNATSRPDDYKKIVEINRRNSGSADEYWFGRGGAGPRLEILKAHWRKQAEMKKVCEAAGIACGFQQGVTLGHGSIYDPAGGGQAKADLHPFTDDAWQVDKDGKRMLMFCPRSPEVLRYEEEYAAALGETLHPVSMWLDDDLRLGFCKPDGCYCTNCLAAFGAKFGEKLTRQELVGRLFGPAKKDPVRRAWLDFLSESLALYGAAARRGMNRTNPNCLVAYQSVDPMTLATGRDYAPLLKALSDDGKHPTSIRIGALCYGEDVRELTYKMQGVAFEAERIRRSGLNLSAVSYEQETYRREALHKTPEAIAVESALALACGCDAVTEYYWDEKRPEPLSYYAEFAGTMSAWRPYFERLATVSRRTSLGGVARFIGSDFDMIAKRTLRSAMDLDLANVGIPVTAASSGTKVLYVNADSLPEWGAGDLDRLLKDGAAALVDSACASNFFVRVGGAARTAEAAGRLRVFNVCSGLMAKDRYPTHAERAAMLDAFDSLAGVKLPVRVERSHPVFVYPRVDASGRVVAVTFYNGAAGAMLPTVVKIRRPVAKYPVWARPCVTDQPLYVAASADEELTVVLPELPARQVGTLFLEVMGRL